MLEYSLLTLLFFFEVYSNESFLDGHVTVHLTMLSYEIVTVLSIVPVTYPINPHWLSISYIVVCIY